MQIPFAQKHSLVWTSFTIVANQILRFKTPTEKWLMLQDHVTKTDDE